MMLEDRTQRVGNTVLALRKDVERYLRQISDDSAARELLTLERDQLRRKLSAADAELAQQTRELERQKGAVQALRKEVARLRAARGPQPGGGHEPE
jgi:regulator of replication initiation timing